MKFTIEIPKKKPSKVNCSVATSFNEGYQRHHKTLFFCLKIRTGIDRGIDIQRIVDYVNWYGKNILFKKMEIEEKYLFTLLDEDHYLIKRALKEHRRIKRLFKIDQRNPMKNLIYIEEELELHIRFEEKQIFPELNKNVTQEKLKKINNQFDTLLTNRDWHDHFWS